MTIARGICPLCKASYPISELTAHIAAERAEVRDYTMFVIKKRHPEWKEEDGTCERCWKLYRGLGRFVNLFRSKKL